MARQKIVGIMGPGKTATAKDKKLAFHMGGLIASQGWFVLSGGVNQGVMDSALRGAKKMGGMTIGIISRATTTISSAVDIAVMTDIGRARNNINAMTSQALVICGMGAGTASEVAFGIQANTPIVLLAPEALTKKFYSKLGGKLVYVAKTPAECLRILRKLLKK